MIQSINIYINIHMPFLDKLERDSTYKGIPFIEVFNKISSVIKDNKREMRFVNLAISKCLPANTVRAPRIFRVLMHAMVCRISKL